MGSGLDAAATGAESGARVVRARITGNRLLVAFYLGYSMYILALVSLTLRYGDGNFPLWGHAILITFIVTLSVLCLASLALLIREWRSAKRAASHKEADNA